MRVSCIIPTRDRCSMACAAIESVLTQPWPDLDLVVVDDGSTDGTFEAVATRFPEARLVRTPGIGPGPARNAGVGAARGEVLMFLDSDDHWLPGHVAALANVLDRGFVVAYGTTLTRDQVGNASFLIPEPGQGEEGEVLGRLLNWCFLVPSALAVHRSAFDACGGFGDHDFGEDWSFFLELAGRFTFGFAGEQPISERLLHPGSLCCLADHRAILSLLVRLRDEVAGASWGGVEMGQRFALLEQWTRARGQEQQWTTVQQWYCALREEGLV